MLTITSSNVSTLFYTEVLVSLTTFRWFVFYLYHTDWYQFYLCSPNTLFLQSLFSLFLNDLKRSISISCKGKFDKICSVVGRCPCRVISSTGACALKACKDHSCGFHGDLAAHKVSYEISFKKHQLWNRILQLISH